MHLITIMFVMCSIFIFVILFLYSLFIIENDIYFILFYILIVYPTRYTFVALHKQGDGVKRYLLNVLTPQYLQIIYQYNINTNK